MEIKTRSETAIYPSLFQRTFDPTEKIKVFSQHWKPQPQNPTNQNLHGKTN